MAQNISYAEIGEQVLAINNQAKALVSMSNALLRQLGPLVDEEAGRQEASKGRPVFGNSKG